MGSAPHPQLKVDGGKSWNLNVHLHHIYEPHFEDHKQTKQMVRLKYVCDALNQNGGLTHLPVLYYVLSYQKSNCKMCFSRTRTLRELANIHHLQTKILCSPTNKQAECFISRHFFLQFLSISTLF